MKTIVLGICSFAAAATPAATNDPPLARIHLVAGDRQYICRVMAHENGSVTITRTLDNDGSATERYPTQQIAALVFPRPASLAALQTQLVARGAIGEMLTNLTTDLAWHAALADIKGNWAAPLAFECARLLERKGSYRAARTAYSHLPGSSFFPEIERKARLRIAVCTWYLSTPSNALAALEQALELAESDAERAEASYYIGRARQQLNDNAGALFSLLRNVVFHSAERPWEAESLAAALPVYAALDQREQAITTCETLMRRFPNSVYARFATNMLVAARSGSNLTMFATNNRSLREDQP